MNNTKHPKILCIFLSKGQSLIVSIFNTIPVEGFISLESALYIAVCSLNVKNNVCVVLKLFAL